LKVGAVVAALVGVAAGLSQPAAAGGSKHGGSSTPPVATSHGTGNSGSFGAAFQHHFPGIGHSGSVDSYGPICACVTAVVAPVTGIVNTGTIVPLGGVAGFATLDTTSGHGLVLFPTLGK
jgi:hypothetical protein